jgi:hypothetical protein
MPMTLTTVMPRNARWPYCEYSRPENWKTSACVAPVPSAY